MGRILLALLATLVLLAPAAQADWPSFHGDALNRGFAEGNTYQVYKDIWWSEKGGTSDKQVVASPVIKDGRLIVADRGGTVRALDAQSGFEFWRFKMPGAVEGTPAVSADHVYVADILGNLRSINLFDGRVEFSASVGRTAGNIAEHEGKIFLGTEAGEMRAYLADLTPLWTFKASQLYLERKPCATPGCPPACGTVKHPDQAIRGKPAIANGRVYFGSLNHVFYALQEGGNGDQTTNALWAFQASPVHDVIVGSPTIVHSEGRDYVVFGSYDGYVYMIDAQQRSWAETCSGDPPTSANKPVLLPYTNEYHQRFKVPGDVSGGLQVTKVFSSPANDGKRVYFGANNGVLYALRLPDFSKAWERRIGSEITPAQSSPAVANGIVVVGSDDKNVYWIDAATGEIKRQFKAQNAVQASPAIDGNLAFVASLDGTWYAFGPEKPKRADLVVGTLHTTNTKFSCVIRNQGEVASTATTVRVFAGTGAPLELPLGPLEPGAQANLTGNVTLGKGTFNVRAFVDPTNQVLEADESNNALNRTFTLAAPPPKRATNTSPATATTEGKGKIPAWDLAVPLALLGVALLLRRRIG